MSLFPCMFEPIQFTRPAFMDVEFCPEHLAGMFEIPLLFGQMMAELDKKGTTDVANDVFQVTFDVQEFKPEEIAVKTVDNMVVVEGKHEEREDGQGIISRHFLRKISLPKNVDPQQVVSSLSSDGVLTVKAPKVQEAIEKNERVIEIQQTGPARESIRPDASENSEKK